MIKTIEIPTYRATCPICKAVFEFDYNETHRIGGSEWVCCPYCGRKLFLGKDYVQPTIYKKTNNDLERLYSQVCRFIKALNPQVNPNNPEEITVKERVFNGSEDYPADEQDLFRFIECFVYENELKKKK